MTKYYEAYDAVGNMLTSGTCDDERVLDVQERVAATFPEFMQMDVEDSSGTEEPEDPQWGHCARCGYAGSILEDLRADDALCGRCQS